MSPLSSPIFAEEQPQPSNTWLGEQVADIGAQLGMLMELPLALRVSFTLSVPATLLAAGGVVPAQKSGIEGLLATDTIAELVPDGVDMPDPLGIAWKRISAAGTIRVGIIVPRLLNLGAQNIPMKLTVLR